MKWLLCNCWVWGRREGLQTSTCLWCSWAFDWWEGIGNKGQAVCLLTAHVDLIATVLINPAILRLRVLNKSLITIHKDRVYKNYERKRMVFISSYAHRHTLPVPFCPETYHAISRVIFSSWIFIAYLPCAGFEYLIQAIEAELLLGLLKPGEYTAIYQWQLCHTAHKTLCVHYCLLNWVWTKLARKFTLNV